ncbi:MAG: D-2-hydroxyacid dehydrogenase [Planctomycetaceae bacterium]|nr:D-2-hydroxyacid dehydrogenase [Planctomycetaceae bacterium]
MTKLLIFPAIDAERLARLQAVDAALVIVNADNPATALREITGADAFFGKLTPALLAGAQQLRWVQSPTASLEHYLFPELVEHPCQLTNMRGLFSDVIADHVMGLILCFARQLHTYIRQQAEGRWAPVGDAGMVADFVSAPGRVSPVDRAHQHLSDLTLGVVGVGHIGAEVCRRTQAFGMSVRGVDPVKRSVPGCVDEIWTMNRLNELLASCDYVVIAAPHTPETVRLFDRARLRHMRDVGVLINIGRGAIVDLHDLTEALAAGELAGAALDVCEVEPLPADHPLWRMPNVIITPHVAAASPRVAQRHLETLLENLRRFLRDEPLLTPVDKRAWY